MTRSRECEKTLKMASPIMAHHDLEKTIRVIRVSEHVTIKQIKEVIVSLKITDIHFFQLKHGTKSLNQLLLAHSVFFLNDVETTKNPPRNLVAPWLARSWSKKSSAKR